MPVDVSGFRRDLTYAVRLLRRSPAFTLVAVATLAFGIGASTAIFTVVNAVLLRPLPLSRPDRLAMLQIDTGARLGGGYLDEWRRDSKTMTDLAGWYDSRMTLTGPAQPIEVQVDRVTANFFDVLGVPAMLGGTFAHDRDLRVVRPEIVLSAGFWQRHFGAAPRVLGQAITLDGAPFTVVGVMPGSFRIHTNELAESRADVWIPFPLAGDDKVGMGGTLNIVGRLTDGATFEQAQSDIALIARRLETEHPSYSRQWHVVVSPLRDATVKEVRQTLLLLFGAVAILLLIACANVASLMLARALTRQTEMTIRLSLGATGWQIVRQLLAESALLASIGGGVGVVSGAVATRLILLALPAGLDMPRVGEIHVDLRVLGFALIATTATALLSGLLPSIVSARVAPSGALRAGARGVTSGPGHARLHNMLVVAEVSLAVVLVMGAALLGRSLAALTRVDPGFRPEHVLTMRATLAADRYADDESRRVFGRRLEDRAAALPGITALGWTNYLPLSQGGEADFFEIEGRPAARIDERSGSWKAVVGGRYFDAMGIPLRRGRLPNRSDTSRSEPVFVVDERLSSLYWPGANPVGQRLRWHRGDADLSGEIIGVVGSVHWVGIAIDPPPTSYFWFPQEPASVLTVVARVNGDPAQAAGALTSAIRDVDPAQPVADVRTLSDVVSGDLARPRFTTLLLGGFAIAALLLAALGLYGVIAYSVVQRRREIGVRVALGAESRDVIGLVMRRGLGLVAAGLGLGLAGALALSREVASLLYGVTATDVSTLSGTVLVLAAAGALAAYLPARRAAHVDPVASLKGD